jgi:hypothetical protein
VLLDGRRVSLDIFSQAQVEEYTGYFCSDRMTVFNQECQRWYTLTSIVGDWLYELMLRKGKVPTRECMYGDSDR